MPKNAIVVGPPRSGTSLAAAIFARKGYFVGKMSLAYKRDGDDHNPFGYYEPDGLVDSNIRLLHQVGHHFRDTWSSEAMSAEAADRLSQLPPQDLHCRLVHEYEGETPWVWKDPRLCHTLPYWWKLMDQNSTRVLLVHRNPTEIYRSFLGMGWTPPGEGSPRERILERLAQLEMTAKAAIESLAIPHLVVHYADYQHSPGQVASRMSEFFEVDITVEDLNFRPDLSHSTLRGRIAAHLRRQLKRLPRRPVRTLERLLPRRLIAMVFPERKYTDDRAARSREKRR